VLIQPRITRKASDKAATLLPMVLMLSLLRVCLNVRAEEPAKTASEPGVAVLLVDTDRVMGMIDADIYGHFLEHINHSVVDGLFAEQIRGRGFEGKDFATYWKPLGEEGSVQVVGTQSANGEESIRLKASDGMAGIQQERIHVQEGYEYDGSVWLKPEQGVVRVSLVLRGADGSPIAEVPLETSKPDWQEVGYSFSCAKTDQHAVIEIIATGEAAVLLDHLSMMRADVRKQGMLRPDLLEALRDLKPPFLRWPGGSFASIYKWKDGIGPQVSRKYHPNEIWGGYSDYYGFGTEEYMELCRRLDTDPLVVLPATTVDPEAVQYAMDWVHYMVDPPTTEWGKMRAANGRPEPYRVPYIQIDNEPMNHGLTPEQYAEIVNVYGSRLRKIAPAARIVACGQKRSNDMVWSQKVIDIAGRNFDILGCHNYEYESENFQTGLRRIQDYLIKLRDYVRASSYPNIKIPVLEWNLSRTYDWRAGLHAAGSLIMYERLSPELEMSCPALLMRNTDDDPTWTAFVYHDHVSWFPGSGYVVEKLFRDHYAQKHYSSVTGTFRDIVDRAAFFDDISQMKPEDWKPGTVDAIATGSEDGRRIIIKAVNYEANRNTLLVRLTGTSAPETASARVYTITAGLNDACSLENPSRIGPQQRTMPYSRDFGVELAPYTVAVVEVRAE
jgi:alpha-N-arabinofuranosidase